MIFGYQGNFIEFTKLNKFLRWYYSLTLFKLNKMNNDVSKIINKSKVKKYMKNIFTNKKLTKDQMNIFLFNLNNNTWNKALNVYNYSNYKLVESFIKEVNIINKYFIKKFNYYQK